MATKRLIIRWDIDGEADITRGLPRVLDLLATLGVHAVFFVNMGRPVSRRELFLGSPLRTWRNLRPSDSQPKIGLLAKLGFWQAFKTFTINRPVGIRYTAELRRIQQAGHELGLHGGMNHTLWQRRIESMTRETLHRTADPALQAFRRVFGQPSGFASPGFSSSPAVQQWLAANEFLYSMDSWGLNREPNFRVRPIDLPVNVIGPGTVPFIEYHDALGTSPVDLLHRFRTLLSGLQYACICGHPLYEGARRGDLLRTLVQEALEAGFTVTTPTRFIAEVSS